MAEPTDPRAHDPNRGRLRFDPTINAGHVLTAGVLMVTLLVWGVRLEGRVDHEAELRRRVEVRIDSVEQRNQTALFELKQAMQRVADKLDRVIEQRHGAPL